MTEFLQSELDQIEAVRGAHGEEILNKWFDNSLIKDRFKKSRVKDQLLRCCYCRKFNATVYANEWDLEHVLCENRYPQFFAEPVNLAIACKRCNTAKRHADVYAPPARPNTRLQTLPTESERYSIPHPRLDQWNDHLSHVNYQIYTSETSKGLELMAVCKLNEPAITDAGLSREAVVTAVRTKFFSRMGNFVDQRMSDDDVLIATSLFTADLENMRAEAFIVGLDRSIQKLTQRSAKRTAEQAVAEAQSLAQPPARALELG
ncbi:MULTISPECIES: HNH endonuclease [Rhizobium]|uniref:HNH endonuclease n=1 Tax=Rhizobium TaxID=379 RepID=UPI001031FA33|nr:MULTISPECIES: hypothetical protein [Rhizobium]TBD63422.1 hypothetical protein ELH22_08775 [Rhizobium ruizarguesonis]UIK19378.1 hypothetical protein LZK79_10325 [Rhizobium leguminosarum]